MMEPLFYRWIDTLVLAQDLADLYPDIDPQTLRFTELHRMICELPNFKDDPKRSNEKILEAIQMAWINEIV
jgi:FeS assembly protein IscX